MAADYPVELTAPDISDYRDGNTGVEFVHTFDSGVPGPHAVINALMHGNEICGAIALDLLLREGIRPVRGKLTLCFVNVAAFARFDPASPYGSRFVDEDLNRVWTEARLDGSDDSAELRRARVLRPIYESADFLLDLHSMGTLSPPIILCHGLPKERTFARRMRYPRTIACGSGHVVGQRLIEFTPFNDAGNDRTALLVECGQHWARDTGQIAIDTALYFLAALEMLAPGVIERLAGCQAPEAQWMLEVTDGHACQTDAFRFSENFQGLEVFERAGTVIAHDGKAEVVTPYDRCVLVMPNHRAGKGDRVLRFARQVSE